tara:strand:+ start:475 stop:1596 length:1122 start_codon:yes stop_codon:yes gene_type:complete
MNIPFFDYPDVYLKYREKILDIVDNVGIRGAFIMQQDLDEFETNISKYTNSKYAIGVANATDALEMLVKAAGIGSGDEVIISSHTMIATASAIAVNGAKPIPVDCGEDHLIDPNVIEKHITPNTKCIMPTQLNGRTSNMDRITEIANDNDLVIIEDSAQALGSKYNGISAGTFGIGGCISFYPAKVLGCLGDGGMILCQDGDLYEKLRCMRDHGRQENSGNILFWGRNSRLDNLQAAILNCVFNDYNKIVKRRRYIANLYYENLNTVDELLLPPSAKSDVKHYDIFQNYEIEAENRDLLKDYLFTNGIGTLIQWGGKAVHQFKNLGMNSDLPYTDKVFEKLLMLPINMTITDDEVLYVCDIIKKFYSKNYNIL